MFELEDCSKIKVIKAQMGNIIEFKLVPYSVDTGTVEITNITLITFL